MKLKYAQKLGIDNYFWSPLSVTKMEAEFKQDKQKRELFSHQSGALVCVLFRAQTDPEVQIISLQLRLALHALGRLSPSVGKRTVNSPAAHPTNVANPEGNRSESLWPGMRRH